MIILSNTLISNFLKMKQNLKIRCASKKNPQIKKKIIQKSLWINWDNLQAFNLKSKIHNLI